MHLLRADTPRPPPPPPQPPQPPLIIPPLAPLCPRPRCSGATVAVGSAGNIKTLSQKQGARGARPRRRAFGKGLGAFIAGPRGPEVGVGKAWGVGGCTDQSVCSKGGGNRVRCGAAGLVKSMLRAPARGMRRRGRGRGVARVPWGMQGRKPGTSQNCGDRGTGGLAGNATLHNRGNKEACGLARFLGLLLYWRGPRAGSQKVQGRSPRQRRRSSSVRASRSVAFMLAGRHTCSWGLQTCGPQ
jgi:hypothetical protein